MSAVAESLKGRRFTKLADWSHSKLEAVLSALQQRSRPFRQPLIAGYCLLGGFEFNVSSLDILSGSVDQVEMGSASGFLLGVGRSNFAPVGPPIP